MWSVNLAKLVRARFIGEPGKNIANCRAEGSLNEIFIELNMHLALHSG